MFQIQRVLNLEAKFKAKPKTNDLLYKEVSPSPFKMDDTGKKIPIVQPPTGKSKI